MWLRTSRKLYPNGVVNRRHGSQLLEKDRQRTIKSKTSTGQVPARRIARVPKRSHTRPKRTYKRRVIWKQKRTVPMTSEVAASSGGAGRRNKVGRPERTAARVKRHSRRREPAVISEASAGWDAARPLATRQVTSRRRAMVGVCDRVSLMAVADDEGSCRGRIGAEPRGVGTGEHAGGAVGNGRPGGVGRVRGVPAIGG